MAVAALTTSVSLALGAGLCVEKKGAFSVEKETWLLQARAWLLLALAFLTKKQTSCEAGTLTPTRDFLRGEKE